MRIRQNQWSKEVSPVREWQQDLVMYRITPAPPKMELQEYIERYCKEKDEKYFLWFLHYYEKTLNTKVMG